MISETLSLSGREWAVFKVNEVFNIITSSNIITLDKIMFHPGNIPVIGCSGFNNGIIGYIDPYIIKKPLIVKNVITVPSDGDCLVSALYQEKLCIISYKVIALEGREFDNKFIYLFMLPYIRQLCSKYSYGYKCKERRLSKDKIILPVDNEGRIDYKFMQDYIKCLIDKGEGIQCQA